MKIIALNTSQDTYWMSKNAWKMIMMICDDLEKVLWSYAIKRYDIGSDFSKFNKW